MSVETAATPASSRTVIRRSSSVRRLSSRAVCSPKRIPISRLTESKRRSVLDSIASHRPSNLDSRASQRASNLDWSASHRQSNLDSSKRAWNLPVGSFGRIHAVFKSPGTGELIGVPDPDWEGSAGGQRN